jgi:hypothetical protein
MEDIGSAYAILLNNPQLRAGLIAEAERSQRHSKKSGASLRLRFGLAHVLQALAVRIQPKESSPSQPVFVESVGQS